MILEAVLSLLKTILLAIVGFLPRLDPIAFPAGFMSWFYDIMATAGYFLPIGDFLVMFGISLALTNFELLWKTFTRLWDALPFT